MLIVDEAAEQAENDQVASSLGLRLALAYLCSIADGPIAQLPSRRYTFDTFWKLVSTNEVSGNPHSAAYARHSMTRSCLQQIGRQLGYGENIFNGVRHARSPEGRTRRQVADALQNADEDRARAKWRKRQGYFGRRYPEDPPLPKD